MPRAEKSKATADKRLRQKSLFDFAGNSSTAKHTSKAAVTSKSSPVRSRDTSTRRKRRPAASVDSENGSGTSSDVAAIHFEPRPAIEISDSDGDAPAPSKRLRKRNEGANPSSLLPVESQDNDSDMGDIPSPPRKKRLVKKSAMATLSDESDSEEAVPVSKRRKLAKGKRPMLEHLSDDSGDEVDEAQIIDSRLRKRGKQSSFQRNLDKLKKKRGGQKAETSSEEEDEGENEEEEEDEAEPVPFFGARRDGTEDIEEDQSNGDEDDFIVEDDGAAADLPAAFSMTARQDPAHLFKIVCQLFVHLAVLPANERHDYMEHILKSEGSGEVYFAVPLVMTRNKLSGLRDSVASSMWRPSLKKALLTLPDFSLSRLDFAVPHCDACHLGGRLSTFMGRASGQPYDMLSFEPIEKESDDEDTSDEDEDTGEAKDFNLGRFCAARVQVFHRFSHWEYTLFEAIKSELDQLRGGSNFVRVGFWKGLQPPENLSDADGIMDWLDQRGFIQMEWQRIKDMMSSASKLDGGREDDQDLDLN